VEAIVHSNRPTGISESELLSCVVAHGGHWFAQRRGEQAGWSYTQTQKLEEELKKALDPTNEAARNKFREFARELHRRTYAPFTACDKICTQVPPMCLYRYAAADLALGGSQDAYWRENDRPQEHRWQRLLKASRIAGWRLIEAPGPEVP